MDELCLGGSAGGFQCERASAVQCIPCGNVWEAEDTSVPGLCPECKSANLRVLRCEQCPVEEIAHIRAHSQAGRLFERVLELEFDTSHFAVPWSDISREEVKGLQILKDERVKYQIEQRKREEEERRNRGRY